jgi:hypothetical protein
MEDLTKEHEEYVLDEYPQDTPIKMMYSCYFCGLKSEKKMESHLIQELGDTEVFVCKNFRLKYENKS